MIASYYQELLSHFTRMVRDRDSAADIVQEAYARVLAQRGEVAQPRALLYHTARNLVIDRHRRSVSRGEAGHAADMEEELANLAAPPACEPETALASAQAVDAMLRAIEGLPPRCREAFILHRFDGLTHAEVAERMGISRKTVEQHIALAMGACRRCKAELDAPGRAPATDAPRRGRRMMAGAGLGLLLSGGLAVAVWRQPLAASSHAALGERIDTKLADGTRLQLLPGSRATASFYRTHREIALPRGHARFEVATDPGRPLTVLAGPLRITVIGTRFSVRHVEGGHGAVRVAVEEGRVRVARAAWGGWFASSDAVDLVAGQAVGSDAGGVPGGVSAMRAADLAPWHVRRASFDNATLAQVLGAFERYGDTGLRVRDPAVAALRVTGTFDLLRPDRFAQLLPKALPVRLAHAGGDTEIRAR